MRSERKLESDQYGHLLHITLKAVKSENRNWKQETGRAVSTGRKMWCPFCTISLISRC